MIAPVGGSVPDADPPRRVCPRPSPPWSTRPRPRPGGTPGQRPRLPRRAPRCGRGRLREDWRRRAVLVPLVVAAATGAASALGVAKAGAATPPPPLGRAASGALPGPSGHPGAPRPPGHRHRRRGSGCRRCRARSRGGEGRWRDSSSGGGGHDDPTINSSRRGATVGLVRVEYEQHADRPCQRHTSRGDVRSDNASRDTVQRRRDHRRQLLLSWVLQHLPARATDLGRCQPRRCHRHCRRVRLWSRRHHRMDLLVDLRFEIRRPHDVGRGLVYPRSIGTGSWGPQIKSLSIQGSNLVVSEARFEPTRSSLLPVRGDHDDMGLARRHTPHHQSRSHRGHRFHRSQPRAGSATRGTTAFAAGTHVAAVCTALAPTQASWTELDTGKWLPSADVTASTALPDCDINPVSTGGGTSPSASGVGTFPTCPTASQLMAVWRANPGNNAWHLEPSSRTLPTSLAGRIRVLCLRGEQLCKRFVRLQPARRPSQLVFR